MSSNIASCQDVQPTISVRKRGVFSIVREKKGRWGGTAPAIQGPGELWTSESWVNCGSWCTTHIGRELVPPLRRVVPLAALSDCGPNASQWSQCIPTTLASQWIDPSFFSEEFNHFFPWVLLGSGQLNIKNRKISELSFLGSELSDLMSVAISNMGVYWWFNT